MRQSLIYATLSAVVQGLAYALLFPLFAALFASSERTWGYFASIAGLILLDALFRYLENHSSWRVYIEAADETRVKLGEQLKQMPLESLASRQAGDLNMVLTGNVQDVVSISGGLYSIIINTIIAPSVTIIASFFVDWRLALALIVLFPVAVPIYRSIRAMGSREMRISGAAHADATSHIIEYTQGLAVLRATRQVGAQSQRLQASLQHLREVQTKANKLGTLPGILMSTIVQVGIVLVTALAIGLSLGGTLGLAAVFALIVITIRFSEPLAMFANLSVMFDFMEAGIDRISELLAVKPLDITDKTNNVVGSSVNFDNVRFSYAGTDEVVLDGLSFTIPERSLTALVGSSGSGKTTVTKLISRYADPQQGIVKIGGVDIRSLSQAELMQQLSVVFQDVYLFDDSILENIRLARPNASDAEIKAAAQAANCHEFIMRLPQGYDTTVGEIGGALSGGERQRISIARAILKDAPIVILDEPTSALDTESEVAVQRAIDVLVKNKTVIVIAHRLSTIVAADNILVLEDGKLVEQGNHSELLNQHGRYADLWRAQQETRHWRITD
ncbi:MAG: ABC transporter ATP-binding protein [Deinococcota bacterium]